MITTQIKDSDKQLRLFDVMYHGVYTFSTVLEHHVSNAEYENSNSHGRPAMDGVVFLCQHPNMETLNRRIKQHEDFINEANEAMKVVSYEIGRVIDTARYRKKARLQLMTLCRNEMYKKLQ